MPFLRLNEPYDRNKHWRKGTRPAVKKDAQGKPVLFTKSVARALEQSEVTFSEVKAGPPERRKKSDNSSTIIGLDSQV